MNELDQHELDARLDEALRFYNPPPPPPLETMWSRIEAACFGAKVQAFPRYRRWLPTSLAAAASLLVGIAIGHFGSFFGAGSAVNTPPAEPPPSLVSPVAQNGPPPTVPGFELPIATASQYLGQTTALLSVLPAAMRGSGPLVTQEMEAHLATQAADLLTTTRMLLDSTAVQDPEMQALLSDLELVLAQVASLSPGHASEELALIAAAVRDRAVISRLQQAALRAGEPGSMARPPVAGPP